MSFLIHPGANEYFKPFKGKDNMSPLFKDMFDLYYYSFLIGISANKRNTELEGAYEIVRDWPSSYSASKLPIINLLIIGYMKENNYDVDNQTFADRVLKSLIDHNSNSNLSSEGILRMNQFAYYGFEVLQEKHPYPSRAANVILDINKILDANFKEWEN